MATPLSLLLVLGAFAGHVRAEVAGYPSLLFISPTAAPLGGARASSWASSRPHLIIAAFHGLDHKGLGGTFALSGACHPSARRRTGPTVMMAASKKDYYAVSLSLPQPPSCCEGMSQAEGCRCLEWIGRQTSRRSSGHLSASPCATIPT